MKNKMALGLLAVLASVQAAHAASFPDVPEDHPNFEAIEFLDENGIVNGYGDGTYLPDRLVDRGEASKIIVGAFGIDTGGSFNQEFDDVSTDDWFFEYVMAGQNAGVINGYSDGEFKPYETVNLAETLKMVGLAAGAELPTNVEEKVFLDIDSDAWYAPHALFARNNNIALSDDYGNLQPGQPMTRAAFAEVIYRMKVVSETGAPFPLRNNWTQYESATLPFYMRYDNNNWKVKETDDGVIFYRPDKEFLQTGPGRIYPNTGQVWVQLDVNEFDLSSGEYFENIQLAFDGAAYTEFTLGGLEAFEVLYSEERVVDWYLYLPDGRVLAVYTEFGDGVLGFNLRQYISEMLLSLKYNQVSAADYTELLSEIFGNILVEGRGMEMLNKLPSKVIIETDTIGVGTGAVDYYYGEEVDHTFKYERASDVILDKREGRTSAF